MFFEGFFRVMLPSVSAGARAEMHCDSANDRNYIEERSAKKGIQRRMRWDNEMATIKASSVHSGAVDR